MKSNCEFYDLNVLFNTFVLINFSLKVSFRILKMILCKMKYLRFCNQCVQFIKFLLIHLFELNASN